MKKNYILVLTLLITGLSFGQILITEIADPNNNSQARFIELYNMGATSVDFTEGAGWQIDKYRNSDITSSTLDLTGTIAAGGFYIIAYDNTAGEFNTVYGFAPDQLDAVTDGVAGSNGDDDLFLVNGADAIVDAWGDAVPGVSNTDNSNTCAEYEDGRTERISTVAGPNSSWDESEWNVWSDPSGATGCTNHNPDTPQDAPGDFDPGAWIGVAGTCVVTLSTPTITCSSNMDGDNNDGVTINIPYTNVDAAITSVTTTSAGTVGGDDPALVSNGTITITGLSEGDAWDITLNGGDCDGTTSSGAVTSSACDQNLVINEILFDPAADPNGDANGDGTRDGSQDEFIEVYNISSNSVDLEGYTLRDVTKVRHTFTGTVLPANSFITVFGGGTPTGISGISQIADDGQVGLNNGGDTATLTNADGIILDQVSYASNADALDQSYAREPDFTGAFLAHESHANSREFSPGETNDTVLSVTKNEIQGFAIYPNPVNNGEFSISSISNASKQVQIFDMLGKQVYSNEVQANENVTVSNLNTGIYILRVLEEGKTATRKLVIQ